MTNEEIKKKIISVLQSVEFVTEKGWCGQCISLRLDYSAIADALIAAGIGDVKTAQEIGASATAMAVLEAAKAEHRAEVAERALYIACFNYAKLRYVNGINDMLAVKYANIYKEQAEKELAEEGKDGEKI